MVFTLVIDGLLHGLMIHVSRAVNVRSRRTIDELVTCVGRVFGVGNNIFCKGFWLAVNLVGNLVGDDSVLH